MDDNQRALSGLGFAVSSITTRRINDRDVMWCDARAVQPKNEPPRIVIQASFAHLRRLYTVTIAGPFPNRVALQDELATVLDLMELSAPPRSAPATEVDERGKLEVPSSLRKEDELGGVDEPAAPGSRPSRRDSEVDERPNPGGSSDAAPPPPATQPVPKRGNETYIDEPDAPLLEEDSRPN